MKQNLLYIILYLLCATRAFAGSTLDIRQVEALPQSEINDILEDSRGLVWIATLDGLFRYDGCNYVSYINDKSENSLSSNMVLSIAEDSGGNIWIGTYGRGLCRLNPRTGEITRYSLKTLLGKRGYANDIVTIAIDKSDNIWIGNVRGVVRLKLNEESFDVEEAVSYPLSVEEEVDYDYINKIHIDRREQIWIGSNNHLKHVLEIRDDELVCESFDVNCNDICDYDDNSIVASLGNVTLLEFDSDSRRYTPKVLVDNVSAMHVTCANSNSISFGGRYGWYNLTRDNGEDWRVTQLFNRHNLPFSLPTSVVSSLEIVGGDQLWVGTRGGGIITVNEKFKLFNSYPTSPQQHQMPQTVIKTIMEDRDGNLWFGTEEDGVYIQNRDDRFCHNMKHLTVNAIDDRAYGFVQSGGVRDSLGRMSRDIVWIGTPYPFYLRAFDAKTYEPIDIKYKTSHIGFVFTLCMSDANTMWAGTYNNGLWRFKLNYKGEIVKAKRFVTPNSTISSNIIRSLYLADDGALWIGTDTGINRIESWDLQSTTPMFRSNLSHKSEKTLNDHYILQITQNNRGDMVIGSMGSGLIIYDRESDDLRFITTQDGLVNNSVKSIVEDPKSGDLWLSTNKGITCYTPRSGKVVNFGHHDGIEETEFSEIAGVRRTNGEIVFGNRLGFVSFTPHDIPLEESMPKLTFTDLFVNYQKVEVDRDAILTEKLEYTDDVELNYEDRNFAIGFVGVDYHSSWGNHYSYRLEGLDDEWREILTTGVGDNSMLAQYTNVPSGDYTFRVRVADRNNILSDREISLDICVLPPWYRSSLAYFIYILLIICAIYITYIIVQMVTRRRHEVYVAKMEQRKVEDMMQYKLEFFMNISHEFRTPLTLLNIPLENIKNKSKNFDVEQYFAEDISEMKYNVGVLANLINQLLDFRKIERGKEIVQLEGVDMVSSLTTYIEHFMPLAKKKGLSLTFERNVDKAIANIDRRHFEKVITNILSNAFKFTPSQGSVVISIGVDSLRDVVVVKVKDSGSGISQEELPHIFERFYSSHNQSASGTGIGLSLCKGLVEMMGGCIWMESELGVGSCCIVEFPHLHKIVESSNDKVLDDELLSAEPQSPNIEIPLEQYIGDKKKVKGSKRQSTILIVDDNRPLLNQLSRGLKDEYQVVVAENGAKGLELCREHHPDLIITDVVMPVMNGIEMCHAIKSDDTLSHTPILILSSDTSTRSKIESFDQGGVDGYLDKPFSMEVLRSNIMTIIHNRDILKSRFNRESIVAPEAVAHTPADIKYIKRIIAIIKDNMSNPELSVEFIATQAGVSRAYLSRKIKEITGETSAQFVRNIRLRYAAKLIEGKNMNISEVAWSVGYVDVNSFRSRFKEMYGVSPTHYNGEGSIVNSEVDNLI